jgi:endogenous inhibitor of DNA gyrase (YacG/DUF329 family)
MTMVYFTSKTPQGDVKAKGMTVDCPTCANTVTTKVRWYMDGPWMGFMGKPLAGKKEFFHVCPICGDRLEQLSRAQVEALRML